MPRGELSLDEFTGASAVLEALPEGLDFGNDFTPDDHDEQEEHDESADDAADDAAGDAADAADDGGNAAGSELDDADDADANADAGDADTDPEPAPAAKEKGKEPRIPKARLDQSIRKQRIAEQRAQELEAELAQLRSAAAEAARPKPLTSDEIKAKMAQANEALIGGDTEKAAALQAELFASLTPQATVEAAPKGESVDLAAQVEERLEFKATVKEVYGRFPELDENHELFDAELGAESVELQQSYLRRGFTMSEATRKAAEAVAKLNDLEDRTAEKAPAVPSKDKTIQAAKTKEKIAKAAKAPPALAGKTKGEGSDKVNINELSEAEFMALPDSVRNKLLGVTL